MLETIKEVTEELVGEDEELYSTPMRFTGLNYTQPTAADRKRHSSALCRLLQLMAAFQSNDTVFDEVLKLNNYF